MDLGTSEILEELEPLYKKAEREGLWFYASYHQMWFSPTELREVQTNGRYIWGSINWTLRNPNERLVQLENQLVSIRKEIEKFKNRISAN